jgi:hypothetical protein
MKFLNEYSQLQNLSKILNQNVIFCSDAFGACLPRKGKATLI